MAAWFVDRVLPGVVTSALWMPLWAALVWLSHRKTRRHIDTVTAIQTAALKESRTVPARSPKRLLGDYPGPRPRPPEDP